MGSPSNLKNFKKNIFGVVKISKNHENHQKSIKIARISLNRCLSGQELEICFDFTNSQLRRPKSDLVHEETMSGLGRITLNPGLKRLRIRIQAGLPD